MKEMIYKNSKEWTSEILHEGTYKGYRFYIESPTNQQFVILGNEQMKELSEHVCFSFWEKYDDSHTIVRLATSWSTTNKDLDDLEKLL